MIKSSFTYFDGSTQFNRSVKIAANERGLAKWGSVVPSAPANRSQIYKLMLMICA